ncbi:hypothetical protein C6H65_10605 [Photorhabdus luminescens]|nr:hypothetical protein KS18_10260 [Photorhabdus luminescens]MBS9430524.1 hypothetical protein [Photorhabdus akhurstii]PQQ41181.1 hypothetical protein C6H65_10605 [Photorhabdus luminescens]
MVGVNHDSGIMHVLYFLFLQDIDNSIEIYFIIMILKRINIRIISRYHIVEINATYLYQQITFRLRLV